LDGLLSDPKNRIGQLLEAGASDRAIIAEFYLAALCRQPTLPELTAACAVIERSPSRRAGLEDVVWGLLNAKEFLLRQ
jgi:hypothetical protein